MPRLLNTSLSLAHSCPHPLLLTYSRSPAFYVAHSFRQGLPPRLSLSLSLPLSFVLYCHSAESSRSRFNEFELETLIKFSAVKSSDSRRVESYNGDVQATVYFRIEFPKIIDTDILSILMS